MPTTADRTLPNLDVLTIEAHAGPSVFPVTVTPAFGHTDYSGQLVPGLSGIRVTCELPLDITTASDLRYLMILGWIDDKVYITPSGITYCPDGFNDIPAYNAEFDPSFPLLAGKKYVIEFSSPDKDHLHMNIWEDCGGDPLGTLIVNETDILKVAGSIFSYGWPAPLAAQSALREVSPDKNETIYPYMMKIHSITGLNEGATSVTFVQQTALSNAADLPAGTYVGYFVPVHPLGIFTYAANTDFTDEYEMKNNKLYTKKKSSLLTIMAAPDLTCSLTDIFDMNVSVTATGGITVTA